MERECLNCGASWTEDDGQCPECDSWDTQVIVEDDEDE